MEYLKIDGEFPRLSKSAVTLGKFDGIHRGHQKLVEKILEQKEKGIAPVETIIDMLKQKDESMHIIMTGRWLPDALKPYVDSITTITTELTDQERE